MSGWITDRYPENNDDVLVSPAYDEQARIGFYVEQKSSWGHIDRSWYLWEGDSLEKYGPSYIDGWMPLPKTAYVLEREKEKGGAA